MTGCASRIVCLSLIASTSGGCLLWSDPVNTAPTVSIGCPQDGTGTPGNSACPVEHIPKLFRGDNAFQAVASDKNQSADSLAFEWWYADKICTFDGPSLGRLSTFLHTSSELGKGCVQVVVTDSQGAAAKASLPFEVVDQAPVADLKLTSLAGPANLAGQPLTLPLFGKVTLTGGDSQDPDDDEKLLDFRWKVFQGDTEIAMPGCPDPSKERYLCTFASETPGNFRVELVVADNWKESEPVEQVIVVATDQLPRIVVETVTPAPPAPPEEAPLQWLASVPITFSVLQVDDDGDPYPSKTSLSRYPTPPAGFVWYYKPRSAPSFNRVTGETGPSFTIKANAFSPQQSIDVRVEYRDRVTACQPYVTGCNAVFDRCAKLANICYGPNLQAQWVTWAVDFR